MNPIATITASQCQVRVIPESGEAVPETGGGLPINPEDESLQTQSPEQELLLRLIEQLERVVREERYGEQQNISQE